MTKKQTRAEIIEQLNEANAELEQLKQELLNAQAETEKVRTEDQETFETLKSEKAEIANQLTKSQAKIAELEDQVKTVQTKADSLTKEVETLQSDKVDIEGKLKQATAALKSPAYTDAALQNICPEMAPQAIDTEAEEAEAIAKKEAKKHEPKNVLEKYESMEAGEERRKFWKTNKTKILKLVEERGKENNNA
jgi:chromosome segregation ATPase